MKDNQKYKKISFPLAQDEDGYPPFSVESLWAVETDTGTYKIDNLPFYIYDISLGDEVSTHVEEGELIFDRLLTQSANSTIRIYSENEDLTIKLKQRLENLGCHWEFSNIRSLSSVNIPDTIDIKLIEGEIEEYADGALDYEVSSLRQ